MSDGFCVADAKDLNTDEEVVRCDECDARFKLWELSTEQMRLAFKQKVQLAIQALRTEAPDGMVRFEQLLEELKRLELSRLMLLGRSGYLDYALYVEEHIEELLAVIR